MTTYSVPPWGYIVLHESLGCPIALGVPYLWVSHHPGGLIALGWPITLGCCIALGCHIAMGCPIALGIPLSWGVLLTWGVQ